MMMMIILMKVMMVIFTYLFACQICWVSLGVVGTAFIVVDCDIIVLSV